MAMQVELFIDQLTNVGLNIAMEQITGTPGAWSSSWELLGPILERERVELMFQGETSAVEEILLPVLKNGLDHTPWTATIRREGNFVMESGSTALQAIARVYIASRIEDGLRVSVSAENAVDMLRELDPIVDALYKGSNLHVSTEVGADRFLLRPLSNDKDDLEGFESVRRMLGVVDGHGVSSTSTTSLAAGKNAIEIELI